MNYYKIDGGYFEVEAEEPCPNTNCLVIKTYRAISMMTPYLDFGTSKYYKITRSNYDAKEEILKEEFDEVVNKKTVEVWTDLVYKDIHCSQGTIFCLGNDAISTRDSYIKTQGWDKSEFRTKFCLPIYESIEALSNV